jgi:shikimate dehydrogenase
MHNAGFKALGLAFSYVAIDTVDTQSAISAMRTLGFRGYSLTIPHKERALHLVDKLSDAAKEIGAINTIVNDGENLLGENTDWIGIVNAIKAQSVETKDETALIYGAGGAAKAAIFSLKKLGFKKILIANRTEERAKQLAEQFEIEFIPNIEVSDALKNSVKLFVNSTPIGSKLSELCDEFPFAISVFNSSHAVFEMVTTETELIKKARELGAQVVLGEKMLLEQALKQFELFTGERAPVEQMRQALSLELRKH